MNIEHLFSIMFLAVATAVIPVVVGKIYKKKLQVEIFLFECLRDFNYTIEGLPEEDKKVLRKIYKNKRPSCFKLLFSKRPLGKEEWFTPREIHLFFIPQYIESKKRVLGLYLNRATLHYPDDL